MRRDRRSLRIHHEACQKHGDPSHEIIQNTIMRQNRRIKYLSLFFPPIEKGRMCKIKLAKDSPYSMSGREGVDILSDTIIHPRIQKPRNIIDGTANIGSDSIGLSYKFPEATIRAVELDPYTFEKLKYNVDIVYRRSDMIKVKNMSILKFLENTKIKHDVVYIDAPWGGRDYKEKEVMKLYLDGKELSEVYRIYKEKASLFIFKIPINYDIKYFIRSLSKDERELFGIVPYIRDGKKKYLFLYI